MARVFSFILEAIHKTLHVIWAWAELEILEKKKQFAQASIDRVSFSIDQALPKLNGNFLQLLDSNFTHKHTLSSLNLDLMFCLKYKRENPNHVFRVAFYAVYVNLL